jgi:hypothetical protein
MTAKHGDRRIDAVNSADDQVDELCDAFETALRSSIGQHVERVDAKIGRRLYELL